MKTSNPPLHLLMLIVFFLNINLATSQSYFTGQVFSPDESPVAFANVITLSLPDSIFIGGTVTDENGIFKLEKSNEVGLLKISYLGYDDTFVPIQSNQLNYKVILTSSNFELGEVIVNGRKKLYELKQDRIVMNVGSSPALSGNTALQVLQKAPGVIVNRQNNSISLNAKGEVLIMINNKIQRVPKEVLLAKLEGMQAENVERIELIHQPSARYDASGAAGIIHIVLKQNQNKGTNGNIALTLGYGQKEKAGASLSFNSRHKNFNLYGDYSFNWSPSNQYEVNHYRDYDYQGDNFYYENLVKIVDFKSYQQSASLGMDVNLSKKTIVGFLFNYANNTDEMNSTSTSAEFINNIQVDNNAFFLRPKNDMQTLIGNVNLYHQFNEKTSLNFDLDYISIDFKNEGSIENGLTGNAPFIKTNRKTPIDIWTIKLDNINQLNKTTKLEIGAKMTLSNISSSAEVLNLANNMWIGSEIFSGTDVIEEEILAIYASYSKDFSPKFNGELGLRVEHFGYQLDAELDDRDLSQVFNNPFPIARLNYKLDSINRLQLSFNRTTVRPDFNSLSAFFLFLDPTLFVYSNPRLKPTFTNNYKLSWQHRSMIFSLAYLNTVNRLYYFNTVDKPNHIQTSTPSNLDLSNVWEATFSIPIQFTEWWEVNTFISILHQSVEATAERTIPFDDQISTFTLQLNSTFNWGKSWSASFDGQYMSQFLTGDQVQKIYPYFNIGIRKKFESGSALSLSFQDIANSIGKKDWDYNQPALGIRTFGDNDWSERQVRLTYSFLIGNQKLSSQRKRDTGANEMKNRM
ncbi:MAG: outer membrane beta-barrel protein [Saprospiraceae bacterium]